MWTLLAISLLAVTLALEVVSRSSYWVYTDAHSKAKAREQAFIFPYAALVKQGGGKFSNKTKER